MGVRGCTGFAFMEKLKGLKQLLLRWITNGFEKVEDSKWQLKTKIDEIDGLETG